MHILLIAAHNGTFMKRKCFEVAVMGCSDEMNK